MRAPSCDLLSPFTLSPSPHHASFSPEPSAVSPVVLPLIPCIAFHLGSLFLSVTPSHSPSFSLSLCRIFPTSLYIRPVLRSLLFLSTAWLLGCMPDHPLPTDKVWILLLPSKPYSSHNTQILNLPLTFHLTLHSTPSPNPLIPASSTRASQTPCHRTPCALLCALLLPIIYSYIRPMTLHWFEGPPFFSAALCEVSLTHASTPPIPGSLE